MRVYVKTWPSFWNLKSIQLTDFSTTVCFAWLIQPILIYIDISPVSLKTVMDLAARQFGHY